MTMTPQGIVPEVLQPGRHEVWGRDRLVLIEVKEETRHETMQVLCADELNFGFDIDVRARLRTANVDALQELLRLQGANIEWDGSVGILGYNHLYNNYVRPLAMSASRNVVSEYATSAVGSHRAQIEKDISKRLREGLAGTPMELALLTTSNFDYPEVITRAVEATRKREIEVKEEQAKQAMALLRADNRMKLAEKMRQVRHAEAKAEAVYVAVMANALTERYLRLREIETQRALYDNVQPGDKVIVTNGEPVMPVVAR